MKFTTISIAAVSSAMALMAQANFGQQVCCYINKYRGTKGGALKDLYWDDSLAGVAQIHANEISNNKQGYPEHWGYTPQTKDLPTRLNNFLSWDFHVGTEELTRNIPTPENIVDSWIGSNKGHRESLEKKDVTVCGAAVAGPEHYCVANLASTNDQSKKFDTLDCSDPNNPKVIPAGSSGTPNSPTSPAPSSSPSPQPQGATASSALPSAPAAPIPSNTAVPAPASVSGKPKKCKKVKKSAKKCKKPAPNSNSGL